MYNGRNLSLILLFFTFLGLGESPHPALAQEEAEQAAEERLGRDVSQQEILQRLRQSGISRQEARRRLQQQGYSADLLDPYFDRLERGEAGGEQTGAGAEEMGQVSGDFAQALADLGLLGPAGTTEQEAQEGDGDEQEEEEPEEEDEEAQPTASGWTAGNLPIFGKSTFDRSTDQFEPIRTGPVDPGYRLGPGDQLQLILTGDVEEAYTLRVNREGFIVIPDVGQVSVNGLTLAQLEDVLFQRLGKAYSGVTRGENQTTFFNVSLGQLRTNQVFIIGEVESPGSYQVSSVSTVFNALYAAGGPTRAGSFRNITIRRGGEVVQRVDLYDYLFEGDTSDDVRLEQGDIVYVPLARRHVSIRGEVSREAIFELAPGEQLTELVEFAGGLSPEAFAGRIQIDRVLPQEERTPARSRKIVDVDFASLQESDSTVRLHHHDQIQVFPISEQRRDRVTIRGAVVRPGIYELQGHMTLWELIREAEGLLPSVYSARAQVLRVNVEDGSLRLLTSSLVRDSLGHTQEDLVLREFDEVVIYSKENLRPRFSVEIQGEVKSPGSYPFAEGMSVKDLVLGAGGLTEDAFAPRAHIMRFRPEDRSSTLIKVALDPDSVGVPQNEYPLAPRDSVTIYSQDALQGEKTVTIAGHVRNPGTYALGDGMTLKDLVLAAGGLREAAYVLEADVSRARPQQEWTEKIADLITVPLDSTYYFRPGVEEGGLASERAAAASDGSGSSGSTSMSMSDDSVRVPAGQRVREFDLQNYDHVYVRRAPGFQLERDISVEGEVMLPGTYSLARKDDRLLDLIERAGGLSPVAYARGFELWRDGTRVGVSLPEAMKNPEGDENIQLEPGDRLVVPRYEPTVDVTGAVGVETKVLYKKGAGLEYYIDQAGGYAANAHKSHTRVRYATGQVETKGGGFLFFGGGVRDPDAGSEIFVPEKPEKEPGGGLNTGQFLGLITTLVSTTIIAITR